MFLRAECTLPEGLHLAQRRFNDAWMSVEETSATLDFKVREAGWNFIWLKESCSRSAVAQTDEFAVAKSLSRALKKIKCGFNVAELGSLEISKYPGCSVVRVTLHARQIQQDALIGLANNIPIRQVALG
jgi:hypothetical protein